jgi:hypothetical protein
LRLGREAGPVNDYLDTEERHVAYIAASMTPIADNPFRSLQDPAL